MRCKTVRNRQGFTLTEMVVTMMAGTIVIGTVGAVLVNSQRGWNRMYDRVYGDVVTGAYVAKKTFDKVVRQSSIKRVRLGNSEVEVYYYNDAETSTMLDRYACFYVTSGRELMVDYGELSADGTPQAALSTMALARNVEAVDFSVVGASIQMILRLDNGSESLTVASTAVRHNE